MVQIGKYNRLRISKERSVGYFFDGGDDGDILMPKRHQPDSCEVGDELDVFVFHDAENRLTATVHKPVAQVDECAWLQVVSEHRVGAFLDWGMTKDLLVPTREQVEEMQVGKYYLVKILLDPYDKIIGTARLDEYLNSTNENHYKTGQEVSLLIANKTDKGWKVVVDHSYWGQLYDTEVFQQLKPGQTIKGYIRKIREEDDKIDVSLQRGGYDNRQVSDLGQQILAAIKAEGGFLSISDKSPPEEIYAAFKVSKKAFKTAVGKLYKERQIVIEPGGLRQNRPGKA